MKKAASKEAVMEKALQEILRMAMDQATFWQEAFDSRDMDGLITEGGDVCDWTVIAILADDALKGKKKGKKK